MQVLEKLYLQTPRTANPAVRGGEGQRGETLCSCPIALWGRRIT